MVFERIEQIGFLYCLVTQQLGPCSSALPVLHCLQESIKSQDSWIENLVAIIKQSHQNFYAVCTIPNLFIISVLNTHSYICASPLSYALYKDIWKLHLDFRDKCYYEDVIHTSIQLAWIDWLIN
jgi:hypothetical protein